MPLYVVYIIAAVSAVVLAVAGVLLGRYVWVRTVRRRVVRLIGRREGVRAAERTLRRVVTHLAEAPDEELVAFAMDAEHEDRRSLSEVASGMVVLSEDLIRMPLPKPLFAAGDALADAAWRVGREAKAITEASRPDEVLERLALVDLFGARDAVSSAERAIEELEEAYAIDEAAVYGGGLYI